MSRMLDDDRLLYDDDDLIPDVDPKKKPKEKPDVEDVEEEDKEYYHNLFNYIQ